MAAYLHATLEITDAALYEQYRAAVPALIERYGGRYLVRGGAVQVLEGEGAASRQVILEFPDMAALQAWYGSADYAPLIALRQRASRGTLVAIEGV
jgi:uncharacterized protein (DUF1330 family)